MNEKKEKPIEQVFREKQITLKQLEEKIAMYGPAHPTYWGCALAGEAGELANLLKKVERDNVNLTPSIAEELADVLIYTILTAKRFNIDLTDAVLTKITKLSEKEPRYIDRYAWIPIPDTPVSICPECFSPISHPKPMYEPNDSYKDSDDVAYFYECDSPMCTWVSAPFCGVCGKWYIWDEGDSRHGIDADYESVCEHTIFDLKTKQYWEKHCEERGKEKEKS